MRNYLFYTLILVGFVSSSCRRVQSKAPIEAYQTFEYKAPVSQVVVPVELSLRDMEATLNQQLNGLIYNDEDYSDDVMMKVWKISPILLSMNGENIVYEVPIKIWTKLKWEFNQFGISMSDEYTADASIRMTFSTKMKIGPFWDIQPETTLEKYDWIEKPVLSGGSMLLPVTMIADRVIKSQQKIITSEIDKEIKKQIQLRKYVEEGWNAIHQPVLLYDSPVNTWLRISPSAIQVTPLTGNKDFAKATICIEGVAETFIGNKPAVKLTNLPNVEYTDKTNGAFVISLVSDISYREIDIIAMAHLEGQEFTSSNGKKKVKIDSIHVYGGNDQLVVRTKVSGSINGTIYLKGKPAYDSLTQSVYLKDLDYTVETKNALVKTGSWLVHSMLAKKMQGVLRYSLENDLDNMKAKLNNYITTYEITKDVTINAWAYYLSPKEFFVTSESIKAVVYSTGTMKMSVKGLDIR